MKAATSELPSATVGRRRPGHHRTAGGHRPVREQVRRPPHRGGGRSLRQQRQGDGSGRRHRARAAAARTLPAAAPGQEEPGNGRSHRVPSPRSARHLHAPSRIQLQGRGGACIVF